MDFICVTDYPRIKDMSEDLIYEWLDYNPGPVVLDFPLGEDNISLLNNKFLVRCDSLLFVFAPAKMYRENRSKFLILDLL